LLYHNVQVMAQAMRFVDAATAVGASTFLAWYAVDGSHRASYGVALQIFAFSYFIVFLLIAERMRVYLVRRTEDIAGELFALCEVALYATGIAAVITEIAAGGLSPHSYLYAVGGGLLVLPGMRLAMRFNIRRLRRRGDDYRVWLIIGHNDRSAQIAETILANPHFGIVIQELIDIAPAGTTPKQPPERFLSGPLASVRSRVLPDTQGVRAIVESHVIDEVVVTLPVRTYYDQIRELLEICGVAGISVKLDPEIFQKASSELSTQVAHVGSIPMVTHFSGPSNYRLLTIKRMIDCVGAAAGLVLLFPVLLAVAAAVKMTSPGPALFWQTRVGLHGRHFRMAKFRSMVQDADALREKMQQQNERDGTTFKVRNDPRITPVGRYLRKYRLDELPQLWNVLIGDMSLVGPRALPVKEAFGDEWWQRRRLSMPPGLTCFWQLADDPLMPFGKWMELDMAYIDRWSLWLDFKLIARTVVTVAKGRGW
jgi:exopolysaccharide biosynthesis polyprenyl glycosylphosphotransferase